jgi:hypothetical protein
MNPMAGSNYLPGAPVQGHGIGKGAVAIEDEAFDHVSGVV